MFNTDAARLSYLSDIFSPQLDLVTPGTRRRRTSTSSRFVIEHMLVPEHKSAETSYPTSIEEVASRRSRRRHRHQPGRYFET